MINLEIGHSLLAVGHLSYRLARPSILGSAGASPSRGRLWGVGRWIVAGWAIGLVGGPGRCAGAVLRGNSGSAGASPSRGPLVGRGALDRGKLCEKFVSEHKFIAYPNEYEL